MSKNQGKTEHSQGKTESTQEKTENNVNQQANIDSNLSETTTQEDFQEKYLRTLAELENTKKQTAKHLEDARIYATTRLAKEILAGLDILDKAMASIKIDKIDNPEFKNFAKGIEMTQSELNKNLAKVNIESFGDDIIGSKFDPNFHEALNTQKDPNKDDNTIFIVYERGYTISGRLLRAAKVGIIQN